MLRFKLKSSLSLVVITMLHSVATPSAPHYELDYNDLDRLNATQALNPSHLYVGLF